MAYIGKRPLQGNYKKLSDISGSFNGSTTAFTLQSAGVNVSPQSEENCIINISGVQQEPGTAFTIWKYNYLYWCTSKFRYFLRCSLG